MIKTITLDGLTSVTVKESPFDMARFCWLYNHSDSDVFASCVNADCIENADGVLRVPAGEPRMLDTESHETLYLNGSGTVEIITSAFAVCPFSKAAKGGDTTIQPLVLLEGNNDGISFADGFTGFSEYYTDTPAGALVVSNAKGYDYDDLTRLGYAITKGFSIVSPDANYTDSAVISSNEKIDLTNYNTICIYFYGYCNYSDITMNNVNDMAAYFMVDRPEVLPQSKIAYDWTGWDNMFMNYRKYGKYYFDISQITGEHYLSFGIYHGGYHAGYNNGIKIYKITLC